jgi:hypothetical protein
MGAHGDRATGHGAYIGHLAQLIPTHRGDSNSATCEGVSQHDIRSQAARQLGALLSPAARRAAPVHCLHTPPRSIKQPPCVARAGGRVALLPGAQHVRAGGVHPGRCAAAVRWRCCGTRAQHPLLAAASTSGLASLTPAPQHLPPSHHSLTRVQLGLPGPGMVCVTPLCCAVPGTQRMGARALARCALHRAPAMIGQVAHCIPVAGLTLHRSQLALLPRGSAHPLRCMPNACF